VPKFAGCLVETPQEAFDDGIGAKRNSRKKAQKTQKKAEMQRRTDSGNRGDGGSLPM
jgi:hypothetical protein